VARTLVEGGTTDAVRPWRDRMALERAKVVSQEHVSEDGKSVTRQVATAFATSRGWSIALVSVS
jgi:hypothetical protein